MDLVKRRVVDLDLFEKMRKRGGANWLAARPHPFFFRRTELHERTHRRKKHHGKQEICAPPFTTATIHLPTTAAPSFRLTTPANTV
jgi:hypothetical protein